VLEVFPFINAALLELPQRASLALGRQPGVRAVTYDAYVRKHAVPVEALQTTYPAALGLPRVWNGSLPATGRGVTVAVIDTGVAADHPDLNGHTIAVSVNRQEAGTGDGYGHGTPSPASSPGVTPPVAISASRRRHAWSVCVSLTVRPHHRG
jgi:subtilisin family serine protease